jgi:tetratricopeptide (TPR) repeat protein
VAIFLNDMAGAKRRSGDLNGAESDLREALRIACKIGFDAGKANYIGNLADIFLDRHDWSGAERLATEAGELAEGVGRQELIAEDEQRLALAMLYKGRFSDALPHAKKAVAICTRLSSRDLATAKITLEKVEAAVGSR